MTLPVADFLQRWLRHVPLPQTRVVRSYGLYHPSHAAALAVCRARSLGLQALLKVNLRLAATDYLSNCYDGL